MEFQRNVSTPLMSESHSINGDSNNKNKIKNKNNLSLNVDSQWELLSDNLVLNSTSASHSNSNVHSVSDSDDNTTVTVASSTQQQQQLQQLQSESQKCCCFSWLENRGLMFGDTALEYEFHSVALHSNIHAGVAGGIALFASIVAFVSAGDDVYFNETLQSSTTNRTLQPCTTAATFVFAIGTLLLAAVCFGSMFVQKTNPKLRTRILVIIAFVFVLCSAGNIPNVWCSAVSYVHVIGRIDNWLLHPSTGLDPNGKYCERAYLSLNGTNATNTLFANLTKVNRIFGFINNATVDFLMVVLVTSQVIAIINLLPARHMLLIIFVQSAVLIAVVIQIFLPTSLSNLNNSFGETMGCSAFLVQSAMTSSFQLLVSFIASSLALVLVLVSRTRAMRELFFWTKMLDVSQAEKCLAFCCSVESQ